LLCTITLRKVLAQKAHEAARRRDADRIVEVDIEEVVDDEPPPEFAVILVDELRIRMSALRDDTLRRIAKLLLEGWSNQEIAEQLECHVRTIERKRDLIRKSWEMGQP
jgi:DNA-directed RNA polymerase specialized sigma24 family protein